MTVWVSITVIEANALTNAARRNLTDKIDVTTNVIYLSFFLCYIIIRLFQATLDLRISVDIKVS